MPPSWPRRLREDSVSFRPVISSTHRQVVRLGPAIVILAVAGCAETNVKLFPPTPMRTDTPSPGVTVRWYDVNGDGRPNYGEEGPDDGVVSRLLFDDDGDGHIDETVGRTSPHADGEVRELFIILDSIPFRLVNELRAAGRFRLFHRPSQIISTFPVITDAAISELFGAAPCPSVEASTYDGHHLTNGYVTHAESRNNPWEPFVDYRMPPIAHMFVYTTPDPWYLNELLDVQERIMQPDRRRLIAYFVSTSAVGVYEGRDGHLAALIEMDRFCQWVTERLRGRVRITLMSDHGHNHVRSQRIPLETLLTRFGYHLSKTLEKPRDVIVPAFGMVTFAAIHTHEPAVVAADLALVEGVAQTIYREANGDIVVLNRDGRALIRRDAGRFAYVIERGDPLKLTPVIERMKASGQMSADGYANDDAWFSATVDHVYPDALWRIWRAFNGLLIHVPDVFVCVEDGYHCGSEFMSDYVGDVRATHGSLDRDNSIGFVMTTAGDLPPVMRMNQVADALRNVGVVLPGRAIPASN